MKILKFIFDSLISYIKLPLLAIVGLFQPDTLFSEAVVLVIFVLLYWPMPLVTIIIGITSRDIVESIIYIVLGIIGIIGYSEESNNSNEWRDF